MYDRTYILNDIDIDIVFPSLGLTLPLQVAEDRIENSKQGLTLPAYSRQKLWSLTGHDLANICNGLISPKKR